MGNEVDSIDTGSYSTSSSELLFNRMMLCIVCVSLLWTTTLHNSIWIGSHFLHVPELSSVRSMCQSAYTNVNEQRKHYSECVGSHLTTCKRELQSFTKTELLRARNASIANSEALESLYVAKKYTKMLLSQVKNSIKEYVHTQLDIEVNYKNESTCSNLGQERTKLLLNDYSDYVNPATEYSQAFASMANDRVSHLADHVEAADDYNRNYLHNKTASLREQSRLLALAVLPPPFVTINHTLLQLNTSVSTLLKCISLDEASSESCSFNADNYDYSAYDLYTTVQESMNAQRLVVLDIFADLENDLEDFKSDVSAALEKAELFFQAISGTSGVLNALQEHFGVTGSFLCDLGSGKWCNLDTNWFVDMNGISVSVPTLREMDGAGEAIWNQLQGAVAVFQADYSQLSSEISITLEGLSSDLDTSLARADFSTGDYNPPTYAYAENASLEARRQEQDTATYLANLTSTLSGLSEISVNISYDSSDDDLISTIAEVSPSSIVKSEFSSSWAEFRPGAVDIEVWITGALTVEGLFMMLDVMYRVLQSWKLLRKHWKGSHVDVAPVDLRPAKSDLGDVVCSYLAYLDSAGIFLALIVCFVLVITYTVALTYSTSLLSYRAACVNGDRTDSTFLMRAMNSIAFNYASMDGNTELNSGVNMYNRDIADVCSTYQADYQGEYLTFLSSFMEYNSTYWAAVRDLQQLVDCVDFTPIDQFYKSRCCHYAEYRKEYPECDYIASNATCPIDSFTGDVIMPPSLYVMRVPSLSRLSGSLANAENALFKCSSLPTCSVSCAGPEGTIIGSSSQVCSCSAEWYLHSSVLQALLKCTIYVILNISRILLTRSVAMLMRKFLSQAHLECRIKCSQAGHIITDNGGHGADKDRVAKTEISNIADAHCYSTTSEEGEGKQQQALYDTVLLQEAIEAALLHHQRKAIAFFVVGILINSIWIAPLVVLEDSIAYQPHEQSPL